MGFRLQFTALATLAFAGCSLPSSTEPAKAAVRDILKDPASAQFRNVYVQKTGVTCGQVNAKNAFGGYVGFRGFAVDQEGRAVIDGEEDGGWAVGEGFPGEAREGRKYFPLIHVRHCEPRDTGGWG
jgi:hypothetical protein